MVWYWAEGEHKGANGEGPWHSIFSRWAVFHFALKLSKELNPFYIRETQNMFGGFIFYLLWIFFLLCFVCNEGIEKCCTGMLKIS